MVAVELYQNVSKSRGETRGTAYKVFEEMEYGKAGAQITAAIQFLTGDENQIGWSTQEFGFVLDGGQ